MKGILVKPWKIVYIAEHPDIEIQTRRVIKGLGLSDGSESLYLSGGYLSAIHPKNFHGWFWVCDNKGRKIKPRYQQGETVYIKEAIYLDTETGGAIYADGSITPITKWRWRGDVLSARCIPAEAARYFITITDVRAERLQEITIKDIWAEGLTDDNPQKYCCWALGSIEAIKKFNEFSALWNSINKDYPWESNPWVWVYTFRREK